VLVSKVTKVIRNLALDAVVDFNINRLTQGPAARSNGNHLDPKALNTIDNHRHQMDTVYIQIKIGTTSGLFALHRE
jgi:hypothetical protein